MHPEIEKNKPGRCPKCGMELVLKESLDASTSETNMEVSVESYKPLIVIIGLIVLVTLAIAFKSLLTEQFSFREVMMNFMAGFFLVFSGFKLLDLKGFAQGYFTYDLLAQKVFGYGYIYPFIELFLGLSYAIHFVPPVINIFTFILMSFSGLGVLLKLLKHERFQCACLGTFLKVPLTKVTLIEDFGMAVMALAMIFWV
jgi:hypothetical protein